MAKRKQKELPKGLQEFHGSLWEPRWCRELMLRLRDLSATDFEKFIDAQKAALRDYERAEKQLAEARAKLCAVGDEAFEFAVANYSVKQIQKATGYDND